MKHPLLLLLILLGSFSTLQAKTTAGPSIAVTMWGYYQAPGQVYFEISVKNNGDQPLTNVFVTNIDGSTQNPIWIGYNSSPTLDLAPGEESTTNFYGMKPADECFDMSQVIVHATTPANVEIIDLSHPYDYYLDDYTYSSFVYTDMVYINTTCNDLNGNSIVDVGDSVTYNYNLNVFSGYYEFSDDNAVLDASSGVGPIIANGIHYITDGDVSMGYIFHGFNILVNSNCMQGFVFSVNPPCPTCPLSGTPSTFNYTVKLTDLLPNRVTGQVKFDSHNDNCATGTPMRDRRVEVADADHSFATFTNSSGQYQIYIPNVGSYQTTTTTGLSANFASNPTMIPVLSSGEDVDYADTDFCISSATGYTNLSMALYPLDHARPGFPAHYRMIYVNNGSTAGNGTLTMTFDSTKTAFTLASTAPTSVTGGQIVWNYADLIPFEYRYIDITLTALTPPTVNDGDLLHFTAQFEPVAGDAFPADNAVAFDQTVVNAFDPNDKTVLEGAFISESQADGYLHYITRFQNTGSATATTVVLKETLDADLDWDTFEPMAASHAYNLQLHDGNDVTCTFSEILLPASAQNETASHGWFAYRIKPKAGFTYGDLAQSKSDIYFDFNLPITTNEVGTQLAPLGVDSFVAATVRVFPNPAHDKVEIQSVENLRSTRLIDFQGRTLSVQPSQGNHATIDLSPYTPGVYLIEVRTDKGSAVEKIVKK